MKNKKMVVILALFILFVNGCFEGKKENIIRKNIKNNSLVVKNIRDINKKESDVEKLYKQLDLSGKLEYKIFQMAMKGFNILSPPQKKYIAIIDFTQDSTKKRFFLINISKKSIVYNDLVAHGMNSGEKEATHFSNKDNSHMSSLGFYVTGEAYYGSNGYSLRLDGLDKGLNDNARKRDLVIHGAPYVSENSIESMNRIGRSWGCPALKPEISKDVIEKLKGGNLLFIYANSYDANSSVLKS